MLQRASLHQLTGSYYAYRYIDQGAQFRVYAIHTTDDKPTGRVVKVPVGFAESRQVLEPHLKLLNMSDVEIDNVVHHLLFKKQQLPALLQGMFAENRQLMGLMGNLKIVPRMVQPSEESNPEYFLPLFFTQDLITPMAHFMHRFRFADLPPYKLQPSDVRRMERLIDQIIRLHYHLWEYGIFECGFKLENVGVREYKNRTRTTLVDIGEYTLNRREAEAILIEQRWRNALNAQKTDHLFVPSILHQHYIDICNKSLTLEALDRHWCKQSARIEKRSNQFLRLKEFLARNPQKAINLWMQRQTLGSSLYLGVPEHRIDDLQIPQDELGALLEDNQATGKYLNYMRRHEQAERDFFMQQQAPTDPRQLGNYILRQQYIKPVQLP